MYLKETDMPKSAYIHIPFCKKKCEYCSFVSYETLTLKNIYIDALGTEIKKRYEGEKLKTLYFGGGTPSILSVGDFEHILKHFNYDSETEVTVEINPNDAKKEYLIGLHNLGINRLSIGIQVFDDDLLQKIGRRHTSKEAQNAVEYAKNAGFNNISIDLIYGLPNQTLENYKNSLMRAIALEIPHISLYGLKIEEGCSFYNNRPRFLPDDEAQADMFLLSKELLEQNGFMHYEISNFAQKGFESKHNLNYWENAEYYGFGVAAHGYQNGHRYENNVNINKYINSPETPNLSTKLTESEKLEEEIFLGFRKLKGINVQEINSKFNIDFEKKYFSILNKYLELKHIEKTHVGYRLTQNGILLSNNFLSEFIEDKEVEYAI